MKTHITVIALLPFVAFLGMGCALSSEDGLTDDMTESRESSIEVASALQASLIYARALSLPSSLRPSDVQLVDRFVADLRRGDTTRAEATWQVIERDCLSGQRLEVRAQVLRYSLRAAFLEGDSSVSLGVDRYRFYADQEITLRTQLDYLRDLQRKSAGNLSVRIVRAAPYRQGTENLVQRSDAALSARQLAEEAVLVDAQAEEARSKFEEAAEAFDEKSNDHYNELAGILKAMQEMQGSLNRNCLTC